MISLWLSYIPQHVVQDIAAYPETSPIGREQRFDAVVLFADVSGFTAMSEALGRSGRAGTEELTDILNSYFDPMIGLIHSYGGVIGKFGGDAMTVLFPYDEPARAATVRRAIQCALDMHASMPRYESITTSVGEFSLAMKAGVARGPVLCTTVGDPAIRLEYIIAGDVLDRCADAEHRAGKGEVIIHNALLSDVGAAEIADERDGFSWLRRLEHREAGVAWIESGAFPEEGLATVARYLHPAVARRLATGQIGFINEHRRVTVLFVRFDGFDYDADPEVSASLQQYFEAVVRVVERFDGYLNKVDMGDKGSKYIVLFGAPVQHEDDEERSLRCALELCALQNVPASIGVNSGFVFCGQVGAEARQEYTVMGDPVNLAARLMQAARPGQVLVSGFTQHNVAEAFAWQDATSIDVKGKAEPVQVYTLQGIRDQAGLRLQEPQYALPLVGRETELRIAGEAIQRTLLGAGQILGITAEAGMGKSRLNAEIVKVATQHGFVGFGGASQSYGVNSSYLTWQGLWRGFFGVDPAWLPDAQRSRLDHELAAVDPLLIQRMPLLQTLLNVSIPDNELTQSLEPQLRAELLRSLLLQCLRERARVTPTLLVLEDAHWMDPLSLELLEFIGRNLQDLRVVLLVLYRPLEGECVEIERMMRFTHATEIRLAEFTPEEAQQLIVAKLEQQWGAVGGLPAALLERVTTKAQGNPFYIEEMINYIHDRGVDPLDTAALEALDLPDSLHNLVMSRIDTLGDDEKTTLKVASVIGRLFKAGWLWGSYPEVGAPEVVKHHLQTLSRLDLTPVDKPEPELEYLFKHITTQEVAYESLTFALRATLHERVGEFVERTAAGRLAQAVDVLAYHYGRSHNTGKQRIYFRQAADAAKAAYSNQTAVEYYQRLLPLLTPTEQSDVMRELGEVWQLVGKWREAEELYRSSLSVAEDAGDRRAQALTGSSLGHLLSYTLSYEEALSWLQQARDSFEQLGDEHGLSRVLGHLSFVNFQQGEYDQALEHSERQLRIAMARGDQRGVSDAHENIGLLHWNQGEHERALFHLEHASEIAAASGYQRGMIVAEGDKAGVYAEQGHYAQALTCLQQALAVAQEIGYLHAASVIIGNAGEIYRQFGDFDRALECYGRALQALNELGDWTVINNTISNVAAVYIEQDRCQEAETLLEIVVARGRVLQNRYSLCEDIYRQADLFARQRRYAEAQIVNQEALTIAFEADPTDILFRSTVLAVRLRVELNLLDLPAAIRALEELSEQWLESKEQASLQYEIWRLDKNRETARQSAAELYRTLYERSPKFADFQRYYELTGATLSEPAALPSLTTIISSKQISLDLLLAHWRADDMQEMNALL